MRLSINSGGCAERAYNAKQGALSFYIANVHFQQNKSGYSQNDCTRFYSNQ